MFVGQIASLFRAPVFLGYSSEVGAAADNLRLRLQNAPDDADAAAKCVDAFLRDNGWESLPDAKRQEYLRAILPLDTGAETHRALGFYSPLRPSSQVLPRRVKELGGTWQSYLSKAQSDRNVSTLGTQAQNALQQGDTERANELFVQHLAHLKAMQSCDLQSAQVQYVHALWDSDVAPFYLCMHMCESLANDPYQSTDREIPQHILDRMRALPDPSQEEVRLTHALANALENLRPRLGVRRSDANAPSDIAQCSNTDKLALQTAQPRDTEPLATSSAKPKVLEKCSEDPITFKDLADFDAKADTVLRAFVSGARRFQEQKRAKLQKSKNKTLLLHGEPGTGKTTAALAIAGELGDFPFRICKLTGLVDSYVGGTVQALNGMFDEIRALVREHGTCVVFLDELDALFMSRHGGDPSQSREYRNAVISFLEQVDGVNSIDNVILIGATNYATDIDQGVVSRFAQKLRLATVQNPLELLAREFAVRPNNLSDESKAHIAKHCRGLAPRDLVHILDNAGDLVSMRQEKNPTQAPQLTYRDIIFSINNFKSNKSEDESRR